MLDDEILAVRNRYQACEVAGIAPHFAAWTLRLAARICSFQKSAPLTEDQRAAVVAEMPPMLEVEAKKRMLAAVNPEAKSPQGRAPESKVDALKNQSRRRRSNEFLKSFNGIGMRSSCAAINPQLGI
jgi:hypothetical protein